MQHYSSKVDTMDCKVHLWAFHVPYAVPSSKCMQNTHITAHLESTSPAQTKSTAVTGKSYGFRDHSGTKGKSRLSSQIFLIYSNKMNIQPVTKTTKITRM